MVEQLHTTKRASSTQERTIKILWVTPFLFVEGKFFISFPRTALVTRIWWLHQSLLMMLTRRLPLSKMPLGFFFLLSLHLDGHRQLSCCLPTEETTWGKTGWYSTIFCSIQDKCRAGDLAYKCEEKRQWLSHSMWEIVTLTDFSFFKRRCITPWGIFRCAAGQTCFAWNQDYWSHPLPDVDRLSTYLDSTWVKCYID